MAIDYPPVFINYYLAEKVSQKLKDYYFSPSVNNSTTADYPLRFFPTQPTSIDTLTEEFPEASENVFVVYDRMFRMRRQPFPHKRTEQLLYYFYKTAGDIEALIETVEVVADLLDNGDEAAEDINLWIKTKLNEQGDQTIYETKETVSFTRKSLTDSVATLTTSQSHPFKVGDTIVVKETNPLTNNDTSFAGTFIVTAVPASNQVSYAKTGVNVSERDAQDLPSVGIGYPTITFSGKQFFLPYFHETKIYQLEEARDIIDFGTARTYAGNKVIIEYCWHKLKR